MTELTADDWPPGFAPHRTPEADTATVVVRDGSPGAPTVISFSALAHPGRRPGLQFGGALARLDARALFVQDPRNSGFHHGAPPLGETFDEVAQSLSGQIPASSRRAGALSASVGAFGAVICGTLLGVDRIALFSPRTLISTTVLRARMAKDPALVPIDVTRPTADLRRWLSENPHPPIDVHAGEAHELDCREAARLADLPGVTVHLYPTGVHAVSRWMHDEGILTPLVAATFDLQPQLGHAAPADSHP